MQNSEIIFIALIINIAMFALALSGRVSYAVYNLIRFGRSSALVGVLNGAGEYVYTEHNTTNPDYKENVKMANVILGVTGVGVAFFGVVHIATLLIKG